MNFEAIAALWKLNSCGPPWKEQKKGMLRTNVLYTSG